MNGMDLFTRLITRPRAIKHEGSESAGPAADPVKTNSPLWRNLAGFVSLFTKRNTEI